MFSRRNPITLNRKPRKLTTSWFQPNITTLQEQDNILSHMYFLVKQGDVFGERLICRECGARHDYITLRCVYKPITGLANGLYAYYRAIKDHQLEGDLSPGNQARFAEIQAALQNMPDLATVHPSLARKLAADLGPSDLQLGALSLGILEGISPTEAHRLADKINEKGLKPRYELNPVNQQEIERALKYKGLRFTRSRW